MKRLLAWLTGIAVLVVALFYLAGGWYFAGEIDATGLQVHRADVDRTLEVTSAEQARVGLVDTGGDSDALLEESTYGLVWPGGYGQVSGDPEVGRTSVTRTLTLLDGSPPAPHDMARLDRDAYPASDPEVALGRPVSQVRYQSPLGSFPAWFVPGSSRTWVIFTHGAIGATRAEALRAMRTTVELGMPSLAITYRNDPGAPRDPSGRWAYGQTEWRDLQGAVRYALAHGADDVVLVGYSMGGAITASFLDHSALAGHVSGVVLDAPMLDFAATIDYGAEQRSLPVVGGQVPQSLVWTARQIASVRYGVDWQSTNYLDDTRWLTVPTLVFHGTDDTRVPLTTSRALAHAHPQLVTLDVVAGAGHVEAWNLDPRGYSAELRRFLG